MAYVCLCVCVYVCMCVYMCGYVSRLLRAVFSTPSTNFPCLGAFGCQRLHVYRYAGGVLACVALGGAIVNKLVEEALPPCW